MKALTIKQPWAELIVSGRRPFEVRNWKPDYQGWLLVHAGKKLDEQAARRFNIAPSVLTFGAIIGKVHIDECIEFTPQSCEELKSQHLEWSDYQPGVFGWRLSAAARFEHPIPWSGSLGLFEVPDIEIPDASADASKAGLT
jgi:ASCH domain